MDPVERLRKAGWPLTRITGFLARCTPAETLAIGDAESGESLRKVLDEVADRQAAAKVNEEIAARLADGGDGGANSGEVFDEDPTDLDSGSGDPPGEMGTNS